MPSSPHISVASGAHFLTYCGGLTAPSADEVLSLLRADAPFNVRVVSVFILFLHNSKKKPECFVFFIIGSASK